MIYVGRIHYHNDPILPVQISLYKTLIKPTT